MTVADNINLVIAIATCLSVAATTFLVILTRSMVRANTKTVELMSEQMEAAARPYIQITPVVRSMTTAVELHIVNSGASPAIALRLSLDKDYYLNAEEGAERNIRKYPAFQEEVQMFPPKAHINFLLGSGHRILTNQNLCPRQFTVRAQYMHNGKSYEECTTVDLTAFERSGMPVDPVADRIEKLTAEVKRLHQIIRLLGNRRTQAPEE